MKCWCGQDRWAREARGSGFSVLRCEACGTHRIDPPPISSDDESADFYTDYYDGQEGSVQASKNPDLLRSHTGRIGSFVPEVLEVKRRAMDIGCGDGHLCAALSAAGWPEVIGFDLGAPRIRTARNIYPHVRFLDTIPTDEDVEPGSVDLATAAAVIEHIAEPLEVLKAWRRYLAPGGLITLTTPNVASGNFRLLRHRWKEMLAPHAHIFLFNPKSMAALLRAAGYEVLSVGSLQSAPYGVTELAKRFFSGDVKGALWRARKEAGNYYSHMIGQGPMLYGVGRQISRP